MCDASVCDAKVRGSHGLSAQRARRTKPRRPEGPQTRSWGPEGPLTSSIFIKDAVHSVLVMKPPPPLMEVLDSKEEKEEYLKNMTKVRHKLRELFSSSTINVIQNYTWMLF